jgi:hypothetical protein
MEYPTLIEANAQNYLYNVLKQCHETRINIYYYVLNISVFLLFIGIGGYVLYYCHTHKLSDYEKEKKMIKDQQYILSKIRFYQEENKQQNQSSITQLPFV